MAKFCMDIFLFLLCNSPFLADVRSWASATGPRSVAITLIYTHDLSRPYNGITQKGARYFAVHLIFRILKGKRFIQQWRSDKVNFSYSGLSATFVWICPVVLHYNQPITNDKIL
jgi:hypothetical protein